LGVHGLITGGLRDERIKNERADRKRREVAKKTREE
jgi:hypothetical protein